MDQGLLAPEVHEAMPAIPPSGFTNRKWLSYARGRLDQELPVHESTSCGGTESHRREREPQHGHQKIQPHLGGDLLEAGLRPVGAFYALCLWPRKATL